jgi:dihydropteroate synthase
MTQLIGILNLTPDSFSDGGRYDAPEAAYASAQEMMEAGATVIDVGAESTRPNATPLSAKEEWRRLSPVLADLVSLANAQRVSISVDTRHAATAASAIRLGAHWMNDVSCGACPRLLEEVAASDAHYVAMHSLTVPADPAVVLPSDKPASAYVKEALLRFLEHLERLGIPRDRVITDVGLGFGKTADQSLALLWDAPRIKEALGCRMLVGHSRKSFLMRASAESHARDAMTLLASNYLMHRGMDYLRVHDVGAHATVLHHYVASAAQ